MKLEQAMDFIMVDSEVFAVETDDEIVLAGMAMRREGMRTAEVHRSPTNDPYHPGTVRVSVFMYTVLEPRVSSSTYNPALRALLTRAIPRVD